jgi:hypothetical protein
MGLKYLIHQTHHKFMGAIVDMGCHEWQCHGVRSFDWSSMICNKFVLNF